MLGSARIPVGTVLGWPGTATRSEQTPGSMTRVGHPVVRTVGLLTWTGPGVWSPSGPVPSHPNPRPTWEERATDLDP